MRCPKCPESPELTMRTDQSRPVHFLILAVLLSAAGATLHLLAMALWPWAFYIAGAFVLVQAVVSWLDCRYAYCPRCLSSMYVWPWSR